MNRIVFWLLATVTVVVLLFGYHTSTSGPEATTAAPPVVSAPKRSTTTTPAAPSTRSTPSTPSTQGAPSPSASPSAAAAPDATGGDDASAASTVTGDAADTQWGPVQVELSVAGGKITDVEVVQYPHGNGRDLQINSYALPELIQETLDAQSAQIDMISGATVTSDGYLRSLQSALDKANL